MESNHIEDIPREIRALKGETKMKVKDANGVEIELELGKKVFMDEDVKRLKEITDYKGSIESTVEIYPDKLNALLARLEAAENVCEYLKENGFPKTLRDKAYDLMNIWRKAAGK